MSLQDSLLLSLGLEQQQAGKRLASSDEEVSDLLVTCQFVSLLKQDKIRSLLAGAVGVDTDGLTQKLQLMAVKSDQKKLCQLLGVCCLQLFVQNNWTGPRVENADDLLEFLAGRADKSSWTDSVLVLDGDAVVSSVRDAGLLALARLLLVQQGGGERPVAALCWALRCCLVHQQVLEEKSDTLHNELAQLVAEAAAATDWDTGTAALRSMFLLEAAHFRLLYAEVKQAEELIVDSERLLGLVVKETGALGKRTKYQTKDVAQLTIDVVNQQMVELKMIDSSCLPADLALNDEVRLNKVEFTERRQEEPAVLNGVQQAAVMARYFLKAKYLPKDSLANEQLLPYLATVLAVPRVWSVQISALLQRSKIESSEGRAVERALQQTEMIVERRQSGEGSPARDRLELVYCSGMLPVWSQEHILGNIQLSLGLTKAALDVFLRLDRWEEVIYCYHKLEMRHKAAEVIRQKLEKKESPVLWCHLGDATDDVSCYQKALELSNNKSARAYRSLGYHHYFKKEYSSAIEYFEKSLARSSFQLMVLLRLAYAAIELERWELAATSYRKYCAFDSDNFEVWNNLAKSYIKLDQKERAWRVLQEAVRCDFDNWKVQDNLMVISVDIGAFGDVIRCYNRILDIKETHVDSQVLGILVRAVLDDKEDFSGEGASKLSAQLLKLMGRVTSIHPREGELWRLYGRLTGAGESQEELHRSAQYFQKSLATLTGTKGWDKDKDKVAGVMKACSEYLVAARRVEGQPGLQLCSSARLSCSSALRLVKTSQVNIETGQLDGSLSEPFELLESNLALTSSRIEELKSQ